ncbi:MAG: HAD-IIA family hydrolase [Chloroflexi bacterium]|nr:HAD-IIA family hydrolase [Chloroflexota bacterium]
MISLADIRNLIIDMDGVLWHGDRPMPRLVEFFDGLRARGIGIVLATNNASKSGEDFVAKLAHMGVRVAMEEVLTSPQATAAWLAEHAPGARVYMIGEQGLRTELEALGSRVVNDDELPFDATHVVVGIDRQLTYAKLVEACLLIRAGARFIGTNPDLTFPGDRGIVPGNGSILTALKVSTDVAPRIIGKPEPEMMVQALRRMGGDASNTAVLGDRLDTDILGGQRAVLTTLLVLSGVTSREQLAIDPVQPDYVFDDIGAVLDALS